MGLRGGETTSGKSSGKAYNLQVSDHTMDEDTIIGDVLRKYRSIAVIGFSKDPSKAANRVPAFLIQKGYHVIPVNPTVQEIMGMKSYPSLLDIPEVVEVVDVFRPSRDIPAVAKEVEERKRRMGDVKVLWLQEGIRNDEAVRQLKDLHVIIIQDRCMYKEYMRKIQGDRSPPPLVG